MKNIDARYAVFGSLFLLSNRLETVGNEFLEGLTTKQWFFMAVLTTFFKNPPTISELAAQMSSSHQNVKQLALRLEKKGFVQIKRDENDNRALRVIPARQAYEYERANHTKNEAFISALFGEFSEGDVRALRVGLERLHEALEKMEQE